MLNNHIISDAGQLASKRAGIFYARKHSSTLYRYPCTPVWNCNRTTGIRDELLSSGKGTDTFILKTVCLCLTTLNFPTPHCIAASERRPTKRAPSLRSTPTPYGSTPPAATDAVVLPTPRPCAGSCAGCCCNPMPPCAASASRTPASCFSLPSGSMGESVCAGRLTISKTCTTSPSRLWPDTLDARLPPLSLPVVSPVKTAGGDGYTLFVKFLFCV